MAIASINWDTAVRIAFVVTLDDGTQFRDALFYPLGQVPPNPQIRADAVARFAAWLATTTTPPPAPTLADKVAAYRARLAERAQVQTQIDGEDPVVIATAAGP